MIWHTQLESERSGKGAEAERKWNSNFNIALNIGSFLWSSFIFEIKCVVAQDNSYYILSQCTFLPAQIIILTNGNIMEIIIQ